MKAKENVKRREGAAAVEMAIVAPLIFLFVFGLVEWGRFEMIRQATSTAAFQAARTGSIPGSTIADIENSANQVLSIYFIEGATITTNVDESQSSCNVQIPIGQNTFVLGLFFRNMTIEREFTVYVE